MALADNALTTPKQVREELGIDVSTNPAQVERYINSVSDQIESYCSRSFAYEAARVEKVAGFGSHFLLVSKTPILSIASITYDGSTIASTDYEIHGDGMSGEIRRDGGWIWTAGSKVHFIEAVPLPGSERLMYEVTYEAGFVTPAKAADLSKARTLPYDLEDACIQLISARYLSRGTNPYIKSEKLMSHSITYIGESSNGGGGAAIPSRVETLLHPYRRLAQG